MAEICSKGHFCYPGFMHVAGRSACQEVSCHHLLLFRDNASNRGRDPSSIGSWYILRSLSSNRARQPPYVCTVGYLCRQSISEAFLLRSAAEAREESCQKQLTLLEAYCNHHCDVDELKLRLEELTVGERNHIERIRVGHALGIEAATFQVARELVSQRPSRHPFVYLHGRN